MSKDLERGKKNLDDNYQINHDELVAHVKIPNFVILAILSLFSIIANFGLIMLLLNLRDVKEYISGLGLQILIALIGSISIFLLGYIGGKIWLYSGRFFAIRTFRVYLSENKSYFQKMFSWFYLRVSEKNSQVYLEGRAKDPRFNSPSSILKLVISISISQLSFFIVFNSLLTKPLVSSFRKFSEFLSLTWFNDLPALGLVLENITALGLAVMAIGLYLPMNFLLTDSNMRTWQMKERKVGTPSAKIRSIIDGIIGFGAIISGWELYNVNVSEASNYLFLTVPYEAQTLYLILDYIIWLIVLMTAAWPLILPAMIYYFRKYGKEVNDFRAFAFKSGVPIGVSMVRLPNNSEQKNIDNFTKRSTKEMEKSL